MLSILDSIAGSQSRHCSTICLTYATSTEYIELCPRDVGIVMPQLCIFAVCRNKVMCCSKFESWKMGILVKGPAQVGYTYTLSFHSPSVTSVANDLSACPKY